MLSAERLREVVAYNQEAGQFIRIATGEVVGRVGWKGYVSIDIDGVPYRAHRLAWLFVYGKWPSKQLDHRDGDKENNRILNLREATNHQNTFNAKGHSRKYDLPRGVKKNPGESGFIASIKISGRTKHLGSFRTPEQASEFYQLAADLLHGEFAYHRCQGAPQQGGAA